MVCVCECENTLKARKAHQARQYLKDRFIKLEEQGIANEDKDLLCPVVHYVKNKCEVRCLVQKGLKVLDRLFLAQVEAKLIQKVLVHVTVFDVRDVRIDHKRDKVEDEIGGLPQDSKSCEAKLIKTRVVHRLGSAHCLHHLLTDFNWGRERFGIAAQDVAKVDYREISKRSISVEDLSDRGRSAL